MYDLNWLAVIVAALAGWFLGYLWYGPLFGKKWMALVGMDPNVKPSGAGKVMFVSLIGAIIMAFVLAWFISSASMGDAIEMAFWIWLGFIATTTINDFLYSVKPKPWALFYLNNGYYLVSLIVMGIILSAWQ